MMKILRVLHQDDLLLFTSNKTQVELRNFLFFYASASVTFFGMELKCRTAHITEPNMGEI